MKTAEINSTKLTERGVCIPKGFAVIVRKDSLARQNLSKESVLQSMETERAFDETDSLLSFGPLFGAETSLEFERRLDRLGLERDVDYVDIVDDSPKWCVLCASTQVESKVKLD